MSLFGQNADADTSAPLVLVSGVVNNVSLHSGPHIISGCDRYYISSVASSTSCVFQLGSIPHYASDFAVNWTGVKAERTDRRTEGFASSWRAI